MMSIALLVILLLTARLANAQTSTAIWTTQCGFDSQAVASQALAIYQNSCENVQNGGGGTFNGSVYSELTGLDASGNNIYNYCVKLACDLCTSADINAIENYYKDSCEAVCQDSKSYYCHAGGYGDRPDVQFSGCGLPITTGECAESSSSIESSSSGESSSSVASSSSVEGGSSASEPGSSTTVHSSASTIGFDSLQCYVLTGDGQCVLETRGYFSSIPPLDYSPSFSTPQCFDSYFYFQTNIKPVSNPGAWCYSSGCSGGSSLVESYHFVGNLLLPFFCNSSTCFYVDMGSGTVIRMYLPANVSVSTIYSLANQAAVSFGYSNYAAAADYCKSIYSSSSVEGGVSSSPFVPISDSPGISSTWGTSSGSDIGSSSSGDGSSSSEESHESSSSGSEESSSSSASDAGSSNSTEISSSTSGTETGESSGSVSSSSEGPYESSSSSSEETGSSSSGNDESSSSSASGIDSSCPDCETNVPSAEAVYTSDQIFNSGLENMEDGKCYSLNPDRGTQYGWINNNAQDSWWWVEVPCDGSAPEEETTSAGCVENQRGSNAVYTSADCFSSGLDNMEEGKCYSLNPDRGTQYGWINNNAQDSWWWVETPCEAEEYENVCPDDAFLYKKTTAQAIEASSENDSTYTMEIPNLFYDVLGHHISAQMASNTKRFLFVKSRNLLKAAKLSSKQWVSIIFSWTIQGGTTEGTPTATITASLEDFPPSRTRAEVAISMTIENLNINYTEKNPDPLIVAHETEHYNRFISYGKATWNECYMLDYNMTNAQKCAEIKGYSWPLFRDQMYLLIEKQNEWDDTDPNNTSIYRIPVQETIDAMHVYFFSSEVECKF